jgi:peptidoglycan/xylan/chitin deacetylase (PgdA/CDA1 family)
VAALAVLVMVGPTILVAVTILGDQSSSPKRTTTTGSAKPRAPRGPGAAAHAAAQTVPASAPGAHRAPREPVPVLMYHLINTPPAGSALPELWVPRAEFAAQVAALAKQGYHAVTMQQVWDAWHHGGLLPSKPIVFSFDDGYHSQFTNALPILRVRRWPGVLNLQVFQTRQDLKPAEVRQMIAAGWEVDAHTLSHPDLTTVDATRLHQEVAGSRAQIKRLFGVSVNFFCYPAGAFDATVEAEVKRAGFLAATTTQLGLAGPGQQPFELSRIRVNGTDGVSGLLKNLGAAQSGAGSASQSG